MRLGQIKHILNTVTNDNDHLELICEPLANGSYYEIQNLESIKLAIEVLTENNLVEAPDDNINKVISNIDTSAVRVLVSSQDCSIIKNYLASINVKLSNALLVINKLVHDQPEDIINVMIPVEADSFKELEKIKKRIVAVLKSFKISEEDIQIVGFDTGSKWYQIRIKDKRFIVTTIIAATGLAIDALNYANSLREDPRINVQVETMNIYNEEKFNNNSKITQDDYIESLVKKEISKIVKEYMDNLDDEQLDGDTREAYTNMVEGGVFKMFEEREKGLMFDPSLNPPEILNVDEKLGYTINYEKLHRLTESQEEKQKELGAGDKLEKID